MFPSESGRVETLPYNNIISDKEIATARRASLE